MHMANFNGYLLLYLFLSQKTSKQHACFAINLQILILSKKHLLFLELSDRISLLNFYNV